LGSEAVRAGFHRHLSLQFDARSRDAWAICRNTTPNVSRSGGNSAGAFLATGVLANMWSAVTLAVWLHYAYVLPEEKFLRDHFDTAYDEYSKRVSRWVRVGK